MPLRPRCRHLLDITYNELALFQSRLAGLRRTWSEVATTFTIPCEICGDARLRRGDDALICLHCGYVGCWSPFPSKDELSSSGKHGQLHLTTVGTHWLAVDIVHFELYCSRCGDFVSDDRLLRLCDSTNIQSIRFRVRNNVF